MQALLRNLPAIRMRDWASCRCWCRCPLQRRDVSHSFQFYYRDIVSWHSHRHHPRHSLWSGHIAWCRAIDPRQCIPMARVV